MNCLIAFDPPGAMLQGSFSEDEMESLQTVDVERCRAAKWRQFATKGTSYPWLPSRSTLRYRLPQICFAL